MTVTINEPSNLGGGQWLVEWSSSLGANATFWIYLNGLLMEADSPTTSMLVVLDGANAINLDVLDVEPSVDDPIYPDRARFAWYAVDGAVSYRVEEYVDAAWTERKTFGSEGADFFAYESRVLEDATTHQFRVVPIGADANEGTPLTYSVLMVRRPDPPVVSYTYSDDDGKVTIASA